jgi:tetratricopeptide (TPR) repeat protein
VPANDPRRALAERALAAAAAPPPPPAPVPEAAATPAPTTPELPSSYDELMRRGENALVADRSGLAYEAFKKATTLRGGVARPWLKLGWAAVDLGRFVEAQRAFQTALGIDAALAEAQFGLAEALKFSGRNAEAVEAYKAYLALEPDGRDAAIARNAIAQLQ